MMKYLISMLCYTQVLNARARPQYSTHSLCVRYLQTFLSLFFSLCVLYFGSNSMSLVSHNLFCFCSQYACLYRRVFGYEFYSTTQKYNHNYPLHSCSQQNHTMLRFTISTSHFALTPHKYFLYTLQRNQQPRMPFCSS